MALLWLPKRNQDPFFVSAISTDSESLLASQLENILYIFESFKLMSLSPNASLKEKYHKRGIKLFLSIYIIVPCLEKYLISTSSDLIDLSKENDRSVFMK